jgi:hypothetical protein
MAIRYRCLSLLVVSALLFGTRSKAAAERVRFHYVPGNPGCPAQLLPCGNGAPGERICRFGRSPEPYTGQPRPNTVVTLHHIYTGGPVTVPLALPWGTPRIEHVRARIVYNYGSYTVEVRFLPDGSVDVIYNSGLLRGLTFQPDGSAKVFYNGPAAHNK